jgi:hypothetical protein
VAAAEVVLLAAGGVGRLGVLGAAGLDVLDMTAPGPWLASLLPGPGVCVVLEAAGVLGSGGGTCDGEAAAELVLAVPVAGALGLGLAGALRLATGLGLALGTVLALALGLGLGDGPGPTWSNVASTTRPFASVFRCTGLLSPSSCSQPRLTYDC